jgi:glycosyl transferase family 87
VRASRALLPALAVLALAYGTTFLVDPWADERVSDLFVYRSAAAPMLDGGLPYRDVFFEYPPLAAPVIALPGVAGTGEDAYRLGFGALALALLLATALLTGRIAARTDGDARRAVLAVAAAPLLTGAMVRTHFDLAPVALTLGALLLLCSGRPRAGMAVLGLGVMTKGYPLVVAPVALAWLAGRGEWRTALQGAAALAAVVAVVGAAALAISPGGAVDAARYQLDRPVQVESLPATGLNALAGLGLGDARPVSSHRSDGLEHPAASALVAAGSVALVAVVALLAAAAARPPSAARSPSAADPAALDARRLVLASLAAIAAFAALGRVLSPQYMIWLVPLAALALAWRMHALAAVTAGAIALTLAWFPSRYFDLVAREPFPLAVVAVRNALLVALLALAWRGLNPQAAAAGVWRSLVRPAPPRPARH